MAAPMPPPPPQPPQPVPPAQPIRPLPPRTGMGCFAKGCLTLIIIICVLFLGCIVGGWFVLKRAVHVFTSTEPVNIEIPQIAPAEAQTAEAKANALRQAVRNNQETTVEFTALDLNALIANDPDFRGARGRARVDIKDSLISLEVSAPLNSSKWKWARDRWFNGHVELAFSYVDDDFHIELKSADANGHSVPSFAFTSQFSDSFNRGLNDSFRRSSQRRSDDFWRHIRQISVQNDKLIVTTRTM